MMVLALCTFDANAAAVVSRTQRPSTSASRMPTMAVRLNSGTSATQTKSDTTQTPADTTDIVDTSDDTETYESETIEIDETPDEIIENKASQFADVLSDAGTSSDAGRTTLAEQIRAQRAALDAADAAQSAAAQMQSALSSGQNACDVNLRACMTEKCGKNFSKCAGDTDTLWGTKLDACRRDLPCSGEEYRLFTIEIKADRDAYARVANYNRIVDCGNRYNDCIITQCGTNFDKCLGKSAGDKAISACEKIARECTESDSGLAARAMDVFGTLRGNAERQVQRDEERLYELRNLMSSTCKRLGAMFDERTLDCVYTINFIAGPDNTLYASKKAYAGSTFDCDQNWFGVDITTFKENAFRLTREQKSATSALMGSGVGMAVGAVTSGAIDRAIDRHKAEKAVKDAQAEHDEYYGDKTQESGKQTAKNANSSANSDKKAERQEKRDAKKAERQEKRDERQDKKVNNILTRGQERIAQYEAEQSASQQAKYDAQYGQIDVDTNFDIDKSEFEISTEYVATASSPIGEDCIRRLHDLSDEDLDACADLHRAKYPILSGQTCAKNGQECACRVYKAIMDEINHFENACTSNTGQIKIITEGVKHSGPIPWPFNSTNDTSGTELQVRCYFDSDPELKVFEKYYQNQTQYLYTYMADAIEYGFATDRPYAYLDPNTDIFIAIPDCTEEQ